MTHPSDLAGFLADSGATVGGGAALGAALGLLAGAVARDLGAVVRLVYGRAGGVVDPVQLATRVAPYGGLFGVVSLVYRWIGLS